MSTIGGPMVVWAKLPGFPNWPGRYCSPFEEKDLSSMIPAKDKRVAIVFFEKKIKKAWVNESSVKEFIVSNLFCGDGSELFTPKTFESNSSYRYAIMEAVRILHPSLQNVASTETLDTGLLLALKLIRKYEPNFPSKTLDDKIRRQVDVQSCEICYGTYCSGELRNCCNDVIVEASQDTADAEAMRCGGKAWVHYHCLQPNGGVDINERWFCTPCCKSYGWRPNRLLPPDDSLVPYFGVVDRFLPPSGIHEHDQLYHVTFEDGDGEEYFDNELHDVMTLFDEFRGERYNFPFRTALLNDRTNWACSGKKRWTKQHPSVGIRVCKYFAGDLANVSAASFANEVPPVAEEDDDFPADDEIRAEHIGTTETGAGSLATPAPAPPASIAPSNLNAVTGESQMSTSTSDSSCSLESSTAPTGSATADTSSTDKPAVRAAPTDSFDASTATSEASKASTTATPGGVIAAANNHNGSSTGKRSVIALNIVPPQAELPVTVSKRESYLHDQQAVKLKMMVVETAMLGNSSEWNTNSTAGFSNIVNNGASTEPVSVVKAAAPASDSDVLSSATTVVANQHIIKKRRVADIDTEKSSAVTPFTAQSASKANSAPSNPITKYMSSAGSNTSSGAVTPRDSGPPRLKCINAANTQTVVFIDECLGVMQRHRSTMEAARINALNSRETIPREFANSLVEAMAGDIIQVVSQSLNMGASDSSNKKRYY